MNTDTTHTEATKLAAICTALGQLESSKAKGEYLLAEIEKNPEWLVRYIRTAYAPQRAYDSLVKAAVPHGLMAKILAKADAGELPPPADTALPTPACLTLEITSRPEAKYKDNGMTARLLFDGELVARVALFYTAGLKKTLGLLRQLGINIEDNSKG